MTKTDLAIALECSAQALAILDAADDMVRAAKRQELSSQKWQHGKSHRGDCLYVSTVLAAIKMMREPIRLRMLRLRDALEESS